MRTGLYIGSRIRFLLLAAAVLILGILAVSCSPADDAAQNTEPAVSSEYPASQEASSGQVDQPADTPGSSKMTDAEIKMDQSGRIFFDQTIDEFIRQYNGCCAKGGNESLLPPSGEWSVYSSEKGIHSDSPVLNYAYSNEDAPDFYPALQLRLAEDTGCLQELSVYYDDHDYREGTYRAFENMCLYSLKSLRPKADEEKLSGFVETLLNSEVSPGGDYQYGIVPGTICHRDGVGVYLYRRGWSSMYFCVIPLTQERLQSLKGAGSRIAEASW